MFNSGDKNMKHWKFYAAIICIVLATFFAFDITLPLSYMPPQGSFGVCLWLTVFAWFLRLDLEQQT